VIIADRTPLMAAGNPISRDSSRLLPGAEVSSWRTPRAGRCAQAAPTAVQLLERVLDHVLSRGQVADHEQREPDQAQVVLGNSSVTEHADSAAPGVTAGTSRSSGVPGLQMTSAESVSTL
jgi:hypothetical protein